MKYLLRDLDLLDQATLDKMEYAGIKDTDQLMNEGALPDKRADLAARLSIPESELFQYITVADLLRVKGIGIKLARSLALTTEIKSAQELASADSQMLLHTLTLTNRQYRLLKRVPSLRELAECIDESRELQKRLIVTNPAPTDVAVRLRLLDQAEQNARNEIDRLAFRILLFGLLMFWIGSTIMSRNSMTFPKPNGGPWLTIISSAEQYSIDFTSYYMSVVTLLMLMMALIGYGMWRLWYKFINTRVRDKLFDRPLYQRCYLFMKSTVESYTYPMVIRIARYALTALLILFLVYEHWIITADIDTTDLILQSLNVVSILVTLAFAFLLLLPDILAMKKALKSESICQSASVHRYLTWRLIQLLTLIVWALVVVQVLLPLSISSLRYIAGHYLFPAYVGNTDDVRQQATKLTLANTADTPIRDWLLSRLDKIEVAANKNLVLFQKEDGTPWENTFIPHIAEIIVWLIISLISLYFILPFVFLNRVKPALIFLAVTAVAYLTEEWLVTNSSGLFLLPPGSILAGVLIALLVIVNSFFFDWIYETTTVGYKLCVNCAHELESDDLYCSRCGSAQTRTDSSIKSRTS